MIINTVYLGIGSNKGNRTDYLISAIEKIDKNDNCQVISVSSFYETRPFGIRNQDNFLNAVIKITTEFSPTELFDFLKQIEFELGRIRTIRWGPREIDLDILFYNSLIYTDENITIPHKGVAERDFVVVPLCEIEPDLVHPVIGKKICEIEIPESGKNIINKISTDILIK